MTKKYNGWANYETWCVNLWLTNEAASYSEFLDLAKEYDKDRTYEFGKAIKDRVEEYTEDILESQTQNAFSGMISDIFHANLSLVDWEEIAKAFLEE